MTYDWASSAPEVAYPDPFEDTRFTRLWHRGLTGRARLTATYEDPLTGAHYSGSVAVLLTGDCFIDLVGVNFDEVQNAPINGKVPEHQDGFDAIRRIKAKVIVEGDPDTTYRITMDDDSTKLEMANTPGFLTTDGGGYAEAEFEIRAVGDVPSQTTDEITLSARLDPEGGSGGGDPLAATEEKVCVYNFFFDIQLGGATSNHMGDEHSIQEEPPADYIMASQVTSPVGAQSAAGLTRKYDLSVKTEPHSAWSGDVSARVYMRMEHVWLTVQIEKAHPIADDPLPLGITFYGILTIDLSGLPGGGKACGFGGGNICIIVGGEQTPANERYFEATQVTPIPPSEETTVKTFEWEFPSLGSTDCARSYTVDTAYSDLLTAKGAVGCQMEVSHIEWYTPPANPEAGYWEDNGVDIIFTRLDWGLDPEAPWRGHVTVQEENNVFEMQ